jgi:hypothetical protein
MNFGSDVGGCIVLCPFLKIVFYVHLHVSRSYLYSIVVSRKWVYSRCKKPALLFVVCNVDNHYEVQELSDKSSRI